MAKKPVKLTKKELIDQEVDRRFRKVQTVDDLLKVQRKAVEDLASDKISPEIGRAINARTNKMIRELQERL